MHDRRRRHDEAEADRKTQGGMQRLAHGVAIDAKMGDTVLRMDHSHRSFPFPYDPGSIRERASDSVGPIVTSNQTMTPIAPYGEGLFDLAQNRDPAMPAHFDLYSQAQPLRS